MIASEREVIMANYHLTGRTAITSTEHKQGRHAALQ
jgi:hypothetical protein